MILFDYLGCILELILCEYRYSQQLLLSRKILSEFTIQPFEEMDFSIESLRLIDICIDKNSHSLLQNLEISLSIVIYFSHSIILSSGNRAVFSSNAYYSAYTQTCFPFIRIFNSSQILDPIHSVKNNLIGISQGQQSKLHTIAVDFLDSLSDEMHELEMSLSYPEIN
jgi:hypothetical protein